PGPAGDRPAGPGGALRPLGPHHPAHGSQRGYDSRQCRFADEADFGLERGGDRIDWPGRRQFRRRSRRTVEGVTVVATLPLILICVAALLLIALAAVALSRSESATPLVYGAAFLACLTALATALQHLLAGAAAAEIVLPLGLPWLGAHFRIDALSGLFLVVVNLGGGLASLYGIGYGRHEEAPARVLPFFAAFLAGMNLVVLAADAFSFLLAWELMSLVSWALVLAHHRDPENT